MLSISLSLSLSLSRSLSRSLSLRPVLCVHVERGSCPPAVSRFSQRSSIEAQIKDHLRDIMRTEDLDNLTSKMVRGAPLVDSPLLCVHTKTCKAFSAINAHSLSITHER